MQCLFDAKFEAIKGIRIKNIGKIKLGRLTSASEFSPSIWYIYDTTIHVYMIFLYPFVNLLKTSSLLRRTTDAVNEMIFFFFRNSASNSRPVKNMKTKVKMTMIMSARTKKKV